MTSRNRSSADGGFQASGCCVACQHWNGQGHQQHVVQSYLAPDKWPDNKPMPHASWVQGTVLMLLFTPEH